MRNSKSGHPQRSFLGSTEGDFKQRHYMREIYLKKKISGQQYLIFKVCQKNERPV